MPARPRRTSSRPTTSSPPAQEPLPEWERDLLAGTAAPAAEEAEEIQESPITDAAQADADIAEAEAEAPEIAEAAAAEETVETAAAEETVETAEAAAEEAAEAPRPPPKTPSDADHADHHSKARNRQWRIFPPLTSSGSGTCPAPA